jgi:hypothetical protein
MKLIISCIISILAKLLIVVGVLFFLVAMFLGIVAPPWIHWLGEASFLVRIIATFIVAGLAGFILIACGMKVSHLADRFIEKH